jgi:hypothetical protein
MKENSVIKIIVNHEKYVFTMINENIFQVNRLNGKMNKYSFMKS